MIYLASPYTHPDPAVRQRRYEQACHAAADIMRAGLHVFSPIAHSHGIAAYGLPVEWGFWQSFDEDMIQRCDELWVLVIDGWQTSRGVQAEIAFALGRNIPVHYLRPEPTT